MPSATRKRKGLWKLTDEHRAFIVQRLACFMAPKAVADALKAEFGAEVTRQAIQRYDPTSKVGKANLSERWVTLFKATRVAFLEHMENEIPHANKAVRVKKLADAADKFEERGNYPAMADMLERIAKEMGNVFTNRREISGRDGKPIQFQDVEAMTEEQVDAELRKYGFNPDVHPAPSREQ